MTNFQVRKVYEYVLNGTIEAQSIVVEGVFTCPGLGPDVVPVELRVISPTVQPPVNALASSSTSFTPGLVRLVVDA